VIQLSREQVLAHRQAVHGLVERRSSLDALAVLDLGVQNTPPGALPAALSARLADPLPPGADLTAGGALTLAWTVRGAPHLHRSANLPILAAACWPRDDADAAARLGWQRRRLAEVDGAARWAYRTVADAVRAVLTRPMPKAALSRAVTEAIPERLSPFCRPCGVHHVGEQLLRLAALPGGARLVPGSRPLTFEPIPRWPGPPADDAACSTPLQAAYLSFFPPATDADIAGFLGTTRAATGPDRPAAVPVAVEGREGLAVEADLEGLLAARRRDVVRLLPPSDPYLQGRDRELLVPDPEHRKQIWTSLGAPGVVVSGVDVVGVWRPTLKGKRLAVAVTAFRSLHGAERAAIAAEAERLGVVRGAGEVNVG
jgi:winged helix DNA-binding protein